jgi:hypothetical protein
MSSISKQLLNGTILIGFTLAMGAGCTAETTKQTNGAAAGDGGTHAPGSVQVGDPCNGTVDCTPGSICWSSICVGQGALRFSLSWTVITDFDLHVLTPGGTEIYYSNPISSDGGQLDVDDCVGGSCKSSTGTHVENVNWVTTAPAGTYTYWVDNYGCDTSGQFRLEVAKAGTVAASQTGTLAASCGESTHFTVVN